VTTDCDKFDDPTPTTLDWLVACGCVRTRNGNGVVFRLISPRGAGFVHIGLFESGSALIGYSIASSVELPGQYQTRGRVRRLFDTFQMTLAETE
jgi:hypothetical protein